MRRRVVEVAQDEEHGVRARFAQLAQVLLGREEALAEQRHVRHRACCAQIVERAGEALVDEDRDRRRACARVGGDDLLDARAGADVAR